MFSFCGHLIIFELLLVWTLVSPSQQQIQTFAKGAAKIDKVNENFGELERNGCADALQVIDNYVFQIEYFNLEFMIQVSLLSFRNMLRRFLSMIQTLITRSTE